MHCFLAFNVQNIINKVLFLQKGFISLKNLVQGINFVELQIMLNFFKDHFEENSSPRVFVNLEKRRDHAYAD
jgi:hypothetical protein